MRQRRYYNFGGEFREVGNLFIYFATETIIRLEKRRHSVCNLLYDLSHIIGKKVHRRIGKVYKKQKNNLVSQFHTYVYVSYFCSELYFPMSPIWRRSDGPPHPERGLLIYWTVSESRYWPLSQTTEPSRVCKGRYQVLPRSDKTFNLLSIGGSTNYLVRLPTESQILWPPHTFAKPFITTTSLLLL